MTYSNTAKGMMLVLAALAAGPVLADPECTTADQSKWMDQGDFRSELEAQGYKIKVFQVTDTNCYEIYGWQPDGSRVEIYYDPVTGEKVQEEGED